MFFTVVGEHEVRAQGADVDINIMAYADDVLNLVMEENEDNWQGGINMMMEVFKKHISAAGLCMNLLSLIWWSSAVGDPRSNFMLVDIWRPKMQSSWYLEVTVFFAKIVRQNW